MGTATDQRQRDNTQLLFGHEEDIATTTKATPVFPLFCCAAASLPSPSSSLLLLVLFFCAVCSPRNNNCKLKRTTGIQITLSRRNQLRQKESAQSSRGESSRVDAGQGPGCAPGPVPVSGLTIVSRHRLHRQAKGQQQQQPAGHRR